MKRNSEIKKELVEISPGIAGIENDNVFKVPQGYFETFPEVMLKLVKESDVSSPDEEIKLLSPLIASLKHKTTFHIAPGYFDTLPQNITGKLAETKNDTPVFQINTGDKRRKLAWRNYAAAAAITGIVAMSSIFLWNDTQDNSSASRPTAAQDNQQPELQLPKVSDVDLAGYLSTVPETPEWALENNADAELVDFVLLKFYDSNMGDMLRDVPDEALSNYEEDISGKEIAL